MVINALSENDVPHDVLSAAETNARYSDQLKLPDRYVCTFEHSGGILRANKAIATLQVCVCYSTPDFPKTSNTAMGFCIPPPPSSPDIMFSPQELFVGHGGVLLDNHRVTRIIPGTVVTVETEKTSFRAKRIIVTAGAWTNKLLHHTGLTLPLKVIHLNGLKFHRCTQ